MSRRKKVGRNDLCPCGSGKKFKRCHGGIIPLTDSPLFSPSENEISILFRRIESKELQRKKQQGLGKPIISIEHKGYRFVPVGSALYWSKKWKTVYDFLGDYIKKVIDEEWGNSEIRKPFEDRHPILQWYHHLCLLQQKTIKEPGEVYTTVHTGASAAYYRLAYDLYSLAHNAQIQAKLLGRLRNAQGFRGARYELFVAATLIRAGFSIEFENEDDRSSSHCEFTATCLASGRKYSVEAKQRESGKLHVAARLIKALQKTAKYPRIVFIEINVRDNGQLELPHFLEQTCLEIRKWETRNIKGKTLPPAYVFITNQPFDYDLTGTEFRVSGIADGFQIPDWHLDAVFPSIRVAYEARKKHSDIEQLLASLREHAEIPATFDGEDPGLMFGVNPPRLLIGETYMVPDASGKELPGQLTSATVNVADRLVYGAYQLMDGRSVIATNPLTDAELAAYKRNPDTFFGVFQPQGRKVESPMQMFDFFHRAYGKTPKPRLLELLEILGVPDIGQLRELPQEELAITYAERCTYAALKNSKSSSPQDDQ